MSAPGLRPIVLRIPAEMHDMLLEMAAARGLCAAGLGASLFAKAIVARHAEAAKGVFDIPYGFAFQQPFVEPLSSLAEGVEAGSHVLYVDGEKVELPLPASRADFDAAIDGAAGVTVATPAPHARPAEERKATAREKREIRAWSAAGHSPREIQRKTGIPTALIRKVLA